MTTEDRMTPTPTAPPRRRALLVGAGLLGLSGLVASMLLLSGSPSPQESTPLVAAHSAGANVVVQSVHLKTPPPEINAQVPEGRNPFQAGYLAPVAAAGAGDADAGTVTAGVDATAEQVPAQDGGVAPGGGTPSTDVPSTVGSTGGSSGTPDVTDETREAYPLKLVAIGEPAPQVRRVVFEVDGVPIDVIQGQRFGKSGELVVLAFAEPEGGGPFEVLLQVGDATPERIAVGETKDVL